MISKTRMIELVRRHDAEAVERSLAENQALLAYRNEHGRNWLHLCCMARPKKGSAASHRTAEVLLRHYDVNAPAFVEGTWKATPLWHAIGLGRNLPLAGARRMFVGDDCSLCTNPTWEMRAKQLQ